MGTSRSSRAHEALNGGDIDALLGLCEQDFRLDMSDRIFNPAVYEGHDGIRQFYTELRDVWGAQPPDLYPVALILTQAMSAYRSLQETFGRVPGKVDDERYITAWVDVTLAVAARYGLN